MGTAEWRADIRYTGVVKSATRTISRHWSSRSRPVKGHMQGDGPLKSRYVKVRTRQGHDPSRSRSVKVTTCRVEGPSRSRPVKVKDRQGQIAIRQGHDPSKSRSFKVTTRHDEDRQGHDPPRLRRVLYSKHYCHPVVRKQPIES